MRILLTLFLCLSALSFAGSASAVTFDVSGSGQTNPVLGAVQSGNLTGTITIDTTVGTVTAGELSSPDINIFRQIFAPVPFSQGQIGTSQYNVIFPQDPGRTIDILRILDSGSLVGYLGGSANFAFSLADNNNNVFSGTATLTPEVSATPLPAALPLFASGLAAAGFIRWRSKRRAATRLA